MPKHLIILTIITYITSALNTKSTVEGLIGLFRHGARKSFEEIPNLTNFPTDFEQKGDLLTMGIRQEFNLGQMLRQAYPDLFPSTFVYNSLNITASEKNRTISSAMSQVSGMFRNAKGFQVDTPKNPKLYQPQWEGGSMDPDFQGDYSLPNGMVIAPILSYDDSTNFLFKSDQTCAKIQKACVKSAQLEETENWDTLEDAYKIFQKNNFSIQEMYGDPNQPDSFESFGIISDALTGLLFRDPQNRQPNFSFDQQAHMIFVNSLFIYSRFSSNAMRKHYLTPLFREWVAILENLTRFVPNQHTLASLLSDDDYSKIQLYFGHQENLSAVLLELIDEHAVDKIRELYQKLKSEANSVSDQDQYDAFEAKVIKQYPLSHVGYGANLLFELVSNDKDGKAVFLIPDQLSIRMLLNGKPVHFKEQESNVMPLRQFIMLLKQSIQDDFESACGNELFSYNRFNFPMTVIVVVLVCVNALLIIAYYILHRHIYNKKRETERKLGSYVGQRLISS